ncbi:MAG TPA: hypothetical protein VKB59_04075 [Micromonosporaceae bacterium]|nr:hypothetical protein [Micromonosporaceae bacterium]
MSSDLPIDRPAAVPHQINSSDSTDPAADAAGMSLGLHRDGRPQAPKTGLITPFNTVPGLLAQSKVAQFAWNLIIFVGPALSLFVYWIVHDYRVDLGARYQAMRVALPLAAAWIVVCPPLFFFLERTLAGWIDAMRRDVGFGWRPDRVDKRQRAFNWLFYPVGAAGAAGAIALLKFAGPSIGRVAPAPGGWGVTIEYVIIAQLGFTALAGLHTVLRWIVVVTAAVSGSQLKWRPSPHPHNMPLSRGFQISVKGALAFSLGALFVPTLFVIKEGMDAAGRTIVWTFVVLLTAGGLLVLIAPVAALVAALARGRRAYLESLDAPLGKLIDELSVTKDLGQGEVGELTETITRVLGLRNAIAAARLVPVGITAGRLLSTLVIPGASLALSLLQTGLVKV